MPGAGGFDVAVCNPPFTDLEAHLTGAFSALADGGRLAMFCIRPLLTLEYQRVMFKHYHRVEINSVQVVPRDTSNPTADLDGRMISVVLHK